MDQLTYMHKPTLHGHDKSVERLSNIFFVDAEIKYTDFAHYAHIRTSGCHWSNNLIYIRVLYLS